MPEEADLLEQARAEAEAIVAEAKEQARLLMDAAQRGRETADGQTEAIRNAGRELAGNLERAIGLLNQVLMELRREIA
jgi:F0F1-type ATP synthase membrane subunit b/b'